MKTIFILISFFILTSCYASGNLGIIQKINDADMIVEGIGNLIEGDDNSKKWMSRIEIIKDYSFIAHS